MEDTLKNLHQKISGPAIALSIFIALAAGCNKKESKIETGETKTPAVAEKQEENPLEKLPNVIATVNGTDLFKKEFEKVYASVSSQANMMGQQESGGDIIALALDQLINAELLRQESERQNLIPSPEAVDEELSAIKSRFPDTEAFEKAISEKGMGVEDVKEEISNQLAVKSLLAKEVKSKISISDEAIDKFYNENPDYFKQEKSVKASHILVKTEEGAGEEKIAEARQKIEAILAEVKGGADFAEVAKKSSEGPSGPNGGDLGYFSSGQMVKPFEDAAFALKIGEVSGIVQSNFGFHIIKVFDKSKGGITPLDEVRITIETYLTRTEGADIFQEYVKNLRAGSTIVKSI